MAIDPNTATMAEKVQAARQARMGGAPQQQQAAPVEQAPDPAAILGEVKALLVKAVQMLDSLGGQ